jgi:hypothetical protein
MWLAILIVIGIVGGIAAAIAGLGPFGIILIILGVIGIVAKAMGVGPEGGESGRGATGGTMSSTGGKALENTPQDTEHRDKAHVKTGFAHHGQSHMVPEPETTEAASQDRIVG